MHIAREFRADGFLNFLRNLGTVFGWNTTKKGALCVFLNDGDQSIKDQIDGRNNPDIVRRYENTCTGIFPDVPELLETLNDPRIDDLKKLHKDHVPKHFIYNGEIIPCPEEKSTKIIRK